MIRSGWRYLSTRALAPRPPPPSSSSLSLSPPASARLRRMVLAPPIPIPTSASRRLAGLDTNAWLFRRRGRSMGTSSDPHSRETAPLTSAEHPEQSPTAARAAELGEPTTTTTTMVESLSWRERAKTFAMEYGRVGICTHIVLSLVSFSVIYVGVSSGLDLRGLLESMGLATHDAAKDSAATSAGSFLIAYTAYKLLAPIRWPLTFAVTPVVMRALRRRGYMLPKAPTARHSPSAAEPPAANKP